MKKIYTIIFYVLILAPLISNAQNNMEDVVYLKNESVIRGIIIEQVPNVSVKIQTKDGSIFVFKYDEILKITKEIKPGAKVSNNPTEYRKKGFTNFTEFTYGIGDGSYDLPRSYSGQKTTLVKNTEKSYGFKTSYGYQFNPNLYLGIGAGIDKYAQYTLIPILADLRLSLYSTQYSPIFNINGGYSFSTSVTKGGLIVNPAVGIRIFITKNVAYILTVGYKWQSYLVVTEEYQLSSSGQNFIDPNTHKYAITSTNNNVVHNFINITMGLSF